MGRKKIVIAKITDSKSRQVTFNKRRVGLMKKAMELSILCDCKVLCFVISDKQLWTYSSEDFDDLLKEYNAFDGDYEHLDNNDLGELVPGKASSFRVGTRKRKKAVRRRARTPRTPGSVSTASSRRSRKRNKRLKGGSVLSGIQSTTSYLPMPTPTLGVSPTSQTFPMRFNAPTTLSMLTSQQLPSSVRGAGSVASGAHAASTRAGSGVRRSPRRRSRVDYSHLNASTTAPAPQAPWPSNYPATSTQSGATLLEKRTRGKKLSVQLPAGQASTITPIGRIAPGSQPGAQHSQDHNQQQLSSKRQSLAPAVPMAVYATSPNRMAHGPVQNGAAPVIPSPGATSFRPSNALHDPKAQSSVGGGTGNQTPSLFLADDPQSTDATDSTNAPSKVHVGGPGGVAASSSSSTPIGQQQTRPSQGQMHGQAQDARFGPDRTQATRAQWPQGQVQHHGRDGGGADGRDARQLPRTPRERAHYEAQAQALAQFYAAQQAARAGSLANTAPNTPNLFSLATPALQSMMAGASGGGISRSAAGNTPSFFAPSSATTPSAPAAQSTSASAVTWPPSAGNGLPSSALHGLASALTPGLNPFGLRPPIGLVSAAGKPPTPLMPSSPFGNWTMSMSGLPSAYKMSPTTPGAPREPAFPALQGTPVGTPSPYIPPGSASAPSSAPSSAPASAPASSSAPVPGSVPTAPGVPKPPPPPDVAQLRPSDAADAAGSSAPPSSSPP